MTLVDNQSIWDPEVDFGTPAVKAADTVSVTIDGTTIGALTRDDGTYRITGAPAGAQIIVANVERVTG